MSKHDDLDRAAHAFYWWPREKAIVNLTSLLEQLNDAPHGATFTIRMGMNDQGQGSPWLCIEGGDGGAGHYEGFNDLFPCPPRCS